MKIIRLTAAVGTALLFASSISVAQDSAAAIGWGGGAAWFGDFNEGSGASLALESGWLATGQAEQWLAWRQRIGVRGTVGFTQRPLRTPADVRDINTWLVDGSLLLRVLPVERQRRIAPFVGMGVGMISYGFGEGRPVHIEGTGAVYPGDTDRRFSVVGSVGADLDPGISLLGSRLSLRVEAADHVAVKSPFHALDGRAFGPVHHLRFSIGVLGLVDLL